MEGTEIQEPAHGRAPGTLDLANEAKIGAETKETEPCEPYAEDASRDIVTLSRGRVISSAAFRRVTLRCNTDAPLSDVIVRLGSAVKEIPLVNPTESRDFDAPTEATEAVLSAGLGKSRVAFSWDISEQARQGPPAIEIKGAADHVGELEIDVEADAAPQVVVRDAADHRGRIKYKFRQSANYNVHAPFPLISEEHTENYPVWAIREKHERILLFTGAEFTIGCSTKSTWQVQCRERNGRGAVVVDKYGGWLVLPENEFGRNDVKFPISRLHTSLRWDGGCKIDVMDGTVHKRSRRGVFCGGLRLDAGWNRLDLPMTMTLGKPDSPLRVEIEIHSAITPSQDIALCLRQLNCCIGELVIWQRGSIPFGFAEKALSHWYPTWSKQEAQFLLKKDGSLWKISKAPHTIRAKLFTKGEALNSGKIPYKVTEISEEILRLERQ